MPSREAVATKALLSPQARRRAFGEPGGCFLWFKIWLVAMASWEGTICSCALPGSRRNQWFQPPGSPPSFWRAWGLLFLGLGCLQPPGSPHSFWRAWGRISLAWKFSALRLASQLLAGLGAAFFGLGFVWLVATASWEGINTISALPGSRCNQSYLQPPGPPPSLRWAWGLIFHVSSSLFSFKLPGPPPSFRRAWGLISMPFGIPSCLQACHTQLRQAWGLTFLVLSSSLVLSQPPDLPFHRWQVWGLLPLGLWAFLGFQPPSLPLGFGQAGGLTLMYLAFWAQSPPGPPPLCFEWRAWGWLIAT